MKKLKDFQLKGQRVLVRCDFNLPLSENHEVLDDFRMKKAIPTLRYLKEQGAKIIIMTHLETKDGTVSVKYILPRLQELLGVEVKLLEDYLSGGACSKINKMNEGEVIMLENLRFHKGEKENDEIFAAQLAKLGDIYVNEAFSVCHRAHASVTGVPKFFKEKAAGFLLEKEVEVFSNLLEKPERPFVAIIGGIKIKTKIKTILNILKVADHVILGSKLGEIVFSQKKIIIGRDFMEEKMIDEMDIMSPKIHLPVDGVMALKDSSEKYCREAGLGTLRKEEEVYDIGPYSRRIFKKIISIAKTILWNGPLGMHEDERFEAGTKEIADAISRNHEAFKVAGGGETVSALHDFGFADRLDFLSTGGGAMLEFLSGEKLPGVEALNDFQS